MLVVSLQCDYYVTHKKELLTRKPSTMKTINLNLFDKKSIFTTLQNDLGGKLTTYHKETEFEIDRQLGSGSIRGIELENGVTFLEFDLTCKEDLKIVVTNSAKTNVNFMYCSKGELSHSFEKQTKKLTVEAFQTSIIANIESSANVLELKSGINIKNTLISVNTTLENSSINNRLREIFINDKKDDFFYCGSYNFKISETIKQIDAIKNEGIVRTLLINGFVNVVLALEIEQHNIDINNSEIRSASLTKNEMSIVKEMSDYIQNYYDTNLQITELERKSGLTAAKLQEGFKLLHGLTICEYVKYVRLTKAEELISKIKKPEKLSKGQKSYYHFTKGIIASEKQTWDASVCLFYSQYNV